MCVKEVVHNCEYINEKKMAKKEIYEAIKRANKAKKSQVWQKKKKKSRNGKKKQFKKKKSSSVIKCFEGIIVIRFLS